MSIFAGILNYLLILPLYEMALGFPMPENMSSFIIWSIIPFNFIKGIVVSVVTLALYKSVSPMLHKENIEREYKRRQQN